MKCCGAASSGLGATTHQPQPFLPPRLAGGKAVYQNFCLEGKIADSIFGSGELGNTYYMKCKKSGLSKYLFPFDKLLLTAYHVQ